MTAWSACIWSGVYCIGILWCNIINLFEVILLLSYNKYFKVHICTIPTIHLEINNRILGLCLKLILWKIFNVCLTQTNNSYVCFRYSGPDTHKISDSWDTPGWDDYLCTRRGIIIAYLAGRGSGLRGDKLKFTIYYHLGGPEVDDILIVGKWGFLDIYCS